MVVGRPFLVTHWQPHGGKDGEEIPQMAIAPERLGIGIRRHFTTPGVHPYDEVEWEERDARITNYKDGSVAFEQLGVEVPTTWSVNATNILAQKYFRGTLGTDERETSLKQVADRVVNTITAWGVKDGYFADTAEAEAFSAELKHLIVTQKAAFNSPVWFNIGVRGVPQQAAACFILSVDDSMQSILNWYVEEGTIFKGGSGSGVNLSKIRSSKEAMTGGGTASGPVSFMRGADASAGTIKSGGKTRRAAKMVVLNIDHPDIEEFIWCKAREERKAHALRDAGFDMSLDGSDIHSIQYQNANNSVRVTDEFMQAVIDDADWNLKAVTDGHVVDTIKARKLFRDISQAAWECADPGVQYDTTINRWHTLVNTGPITASNPCSEYLSVDNSSCNLASLNLMKFLNDDDTFNVDSFKAAIEVVFTAQEILVGNADYPTPAIAENTRRFRQLGLGYANLGALLMAQGLPYDSEEGRSWAGAITALLTGHAYVTSARTAARMGPFAGYHENAEHMLRVLGMHREAVAKINEEQVTPELLSAAQEAWDTAVELAEVNGVRNSQASVCAPTGTIGLLLDCDTTGIEPDLSLVKTKKLVGGGTMSIVNQTVPRALDKLGYSPEEREAIVAFIAENHTIVGAPGLKEEHKPVFACSMGDNVIHHMGHIRMMGAAQPFFSGAISKCVTGDSLVTTAEGLIRIGSLHIAEQPDSFRPEFLNVASTGGIRKTDAFYYGGTKPVRKARLRSGHEITGTSNHRVLTAAEAGFEWKALEDLEPGDTVAVQYGADLWSDVPGWIANFEAAPAHGNQKAFTPPLELSEELSFLLGAYASEGHIARSNWTVKITNSVPEVLARVARAFETELGIKAQVVLPKDRCAYVAATSKAMVELFEHLGCGDRASNKRIPDAVLRSTREHVLAFLQGLSLDAYTAGPQGAKWAICLDSPGLLDDLQAVLTNLGVVHSRIAKFNSENGKTYGEVYATGTHARRLVELVPFLEPDKAARAIVNVGSIEGDDRNTADLVPISPRALYELLPRQRRRGQGYIRGNFAYLCDDRTRFATRRSLERVAAVDGVVLPPWLKSVLHDNLHFSPVAAIEDAGIREVFDLSVPQTHAFVANGLVNHNTVNLPETATVEDIEEAYMESWKLGLKAVAVYRDNCKLGQPLSTTKKEPAAETAPQELATTAAPVLAAPSITDELEGLQKSYDSNVLVVREPIRERMPKRRRSSTFKFRVADCEGYVTVGEYDDGRPGEIFVRVAKQGSTLAGIMDAFAVSVSLGLQYGVPLATYVNQYCNTRFEPAGMTDDPDLRIASSLIDYIFRRLAVDYLEKGQRETLGILTSSERIQPTLPGVEEVATPNEPLPLEPPAATTTASPVAANPEPRTSDAPYCSQCGIQMVRAGSCHACPSCGTTSGCS